MTEIAHLELGRRGPDGSREVAVVDAQGHRHRGVLTDPELVDDYTGRSPAEERPPA